MASQIAIGAVHAPNPYLRRPAPRKEPHQLFWLFCIGSALDFRGQTAGGAVQTVLFLVSTLAFVLIILSARRPSLVYLRPLYRMTFSWWLYLLISLPVALYWSVPLTNYLKAFIPSLLMGESLILGLLLISSSASNVGLLIDGIYWSCFTSAAIYLFNGLVVMGLSIDTARFHITSPLLSALVAVSLWSYCWQRNGHVKRYLVSLIFGLTVMYLSLTRSYIVSIGCVLLCVLPLLLLRPPWYTKALQTATITRGSIFAGLLLLVAAVALITLPGIARSWGARTSTIGEADPSGLSRISEAAGELEKMASSPARFVLGSGIGSDHLMDLVYLKDIAAWSGDDSINDAIWEPGHILWPYQFYATGAFLGCLLPVLMLIALFRGVTTKHNYLPFIAASAIAGVIGESTFANVLGARSGGAMLGLLIAVALSKEALAPRAESRPS